MTNPTEETVADVLAEAEGYALGHAEYMGDQAYYPNSDEHLESLLDRIAAALARGRAEDVEMIRVTEIANRTLANGCKDRDATIYFLQDAQERERKTILKVAQDMEDRAGDNAVPGAIWAADVRQTMEWAARLRAIAGEKP